MPVCAIVGAAAFNSQHFQELDSSGSFDYVIAVDGGFAHLESIGRTPDLAVGDFDSLGYVPRCKRVSRHNPKKAQSDMELALSRAADMGFEEVYAYGGLSGRLDHTLANLQVFAGYSERGMSVTGVGDVFLARFLTGPDAFDLPLRQSGTVSIFSMSDVSRGVIVRGLEYPLDDAELTSRVSLGLSNEFIGESAAVGLGEGTIVVFYPIGGDVDLDGAPAGV